MRGNDRRRGGVDILRAFAVVAAMGMAMAAGSTSAQSIYRFKKSPQPRRQGESVQPYITCTASYDIDGVHYVYRGRFSVAEWVEVLKFHHASVYAERRADRVDVDKAAVVATGAAPVLRTYYFQSYRIEPSSFEIMGAPIRLAQVPRSVAQSFDTRRGRWTDILRFQGGDGTVTLRSRQDRSRADAFTRPFTIGIVINGNRSIYTAHFSPDPRREAAVAGRLFSVGRQYFLGKPVDLPACINDATGKPTRRRRS